jgi:hypothetical protein
VTEYHTDPDGKQWSRVGSLEAIGGYQHLQAGSRNDIFESHDGDRWVLERPEPEMEDAAFSRESELRSLRAAVEKLADHIVNEETNLHTAACDRCDALRDVARRLREILEGK